MGRNEKCALRHAQRDPSCHRNREHSVFLFLCWFFLEGFTPQPVSDWTIIQFSNQMESPKFDQVLKSKQRKKKKIHWQLCAACMLARKNVGAMLLRDDWSCNPLCSLERTGRFVFSPASSKKDRTRYQQFCFRVLFLHWNLSKHMIFMTCLFYGFKSVTIPHISKDNFKQSVKSVTFTSTWRLLFHQILTAVTVALQINFAFSREFKLAAPFDQIKCNLTGYASLTLYVLAEACWVQQQEGVVVSCYNLIRLRQLNLSCWKCCTHTHGPRIMSTEQTSMTNVKCCRIARSTE